MEIDERAHIIARGSVEIAAPPLYVWTIISDIDHWPGWNPDIESAVLEGPLEPGTRFRWQAGPGTITSVLRSVEPGRELGWTGVTMGVHAVHVWRLEPTQWGTLVTTEESWSGWPTRVMHARLEATLRRAVGSGVHHLKTEAELRSRVAVLRPVA
jgi:uncharacterized protein YndB with AHSA1/START domain